MKAWWDGSEMVEWENWARNQLMAAGSELLGKFSYLQYIVFAKMLLLKTRDLLFEASAVSTFKIRSISWWLFRTLLIHQRILDERSSSILELLQVFKGEISSHFGSLEKVTSYWGAQLQDGEPSTIVSMVHLESGVLEYIYGRLDPCRLHLESAEVAAGLQLSVTGVLGVRTVHQVEPKAQMILVANTSSKSVSDDICTSIAPGPGIQLSGPKVSEASDIFMTPMLVENGNDFGKNECGGGAATLTAVQQAVVLAQCLLIKKGSPHDEMQGWDMAPYIEAIDSQQSSYFILQCFCNTLRIRWESTRSRTKERALQMMDNLVESIHKPSPGVPLRLPFCYAVYIPTILALRKQYGDILVSCGLIGEALKIFEDLESWDNLIYCYCQLEKKAAAVELIKMRLSKTPNDPRLWCSLGDITNSDASYEKALEVSNDRSARAKRSLACNAYQRGEYERSKILWESAMALNSLYPDGWFALGAAALKARDVEKALDGFTRAVQLDPENGEAWNNIACLHMIKKKSKESFIAFKEALKYKRDSWQMWENYSHVALDVGNIGQALEAIKMVLNITNNKRIDVELLERIMQYLEVRASVKLSAVTNDDDLSNQTSPDSLVYSVNTSANAEQTAGKLRENEHLVEFLGKILQQILRSDSRAELWGLYARWHRIKGDLTMCCEALLKQVRSYQLQCLCNILRIRWESTRSRTKERALQMMDNLVESIHKPSPGVPLRLPFCYAVYIPTILALRKHYGDILVSCGLIGEALKIFEDLESWDNLICYCQLEKKAAAVELIKMRLSKTPNDPRLWCSLGDITNSDAYYEKALDVSNDRSARAKRSLARNAYQRGEYERSKILWESAMALNSLYPDGWFALGAAVLKARDVEKALDGFTRAVQLDPENGEAWNNIACLHMIKKKSKESFIAFKEALKYKRDSWQMWENYSHVALDVGNIGQALEAIKMVLNITKNKRIDVELLERIMQYLEERASVKLSAVTNDDDLSNQTSPDSLVYSVNTSANAEQTAGKLRENEHLVEFLGKILQQILRSESRAELWGLYARWHRIKGDLTMCCEAPLKQVRSYQGSDLWKHRDRFKRFAQASLDLCKVYMDISSSTDSHRELLTAEMHLKNILKQGIDIELLRQHAFLLGNADNTSRCNCKL